MENKITQKDLRIGCYTNKGKVEVINSDSAFCYIPEKGQSIFHKLHGNYFKFYEVAHSISPNGLGLAAVVG